MQRPASPVILRGPAFLVFRFLKVGKHIRVAPTGIAQVAPAVVVAALTADINHGVDRAAAAQHLAARPIEAAVSQLSLRLRVVSPITRTFKQLGEGYRYVDFS